MPGGQGLALRAIEELQVGLRHLAGALLVHHLVDHGHGRLGQDRQGRRHDLDLVGAQLLDRQVGLVLPGQQHVAQATLHERVRGAARARVEHGDVLEELRDVVARLLLVAAGLLQGPGPAGQVVPARAARGLGVGRDDLDARLDQVAPVLDALGVALAHQEDDGRGVGRAVLRQALLPGGVEQAAVLGDGVDVVGQGQRHHVGLQPVDDRAGLLARAAVRLLHGHVLAGPGFPAPGELHVEVRVELAGGVIRDVEQRDLGPRLRGDPQDECNGNGHGLAHEDSPPRKRPGNG